MALLHVQPKGGAMLRVRYPNGRVIRRVGRAGRAPPMSVYVDRLREWGWNLGPSAHLFADTPEELHHFAVAVLGLKRKWFQDRPDFPHYDLTAPRHARALNRGATLATDAFMVAWVREHRERGPGRARTP